MGHVVRFPRECRTHPLPVQEYWPERVEADVSPEPVEEIAPPRRFPVLPMQVGRSRLPAEQRRAIRRDRRRELEHQRKESLS